MRRRRGRREIAAAAVIVAVAILCVLGLPPLSRTPAGVRVVAFLLAFLATPGWLWVRRWPGDEPGIARLGRILLLGALHDLLLLTVFAAVGLGLRTGLWVWGATLLLALAVGRRPGARPHLAAGEDRVAVSTPADGAAVAAFAVLAVGLALWMGMTAVRPSLHNDGPAHQAAILDAIQADAWLPPDRSVRADAIEVDPRFGLGHGLYAAASVATSVDAGDVLRYAPVVLAPLGLLAYGWLFVEFGLPGWGALLARKIKVLSSTGGRGFGLWASAYPGNLALALATFGLAGWIASQVRSPSSWGFALGGGRWVGPVVVALTATLHPFPWWAFVLAMLHATVLLLLRRADRTVARGLLLSTTACLVLGVLLLLPRWLERAQIGPTHHQIVLDALLLNGGLFVVDPLALLRWSSHTTLWVVPVALLVIDRWRHSRRALIALGGALVVWTVALDPLVEPLAWRVVAYLSVRVGRLSYPPALWLLTLGFAWSALRARRRLASRLFALVPLVLAGWFLVREVRSSIDVVRHGPPRRDQRIWQELDEIASGLDRLPPGRPLADPRTSYGLRALRGGAFVLTPRAHSSPRDTQLLARLDLYRGMLDSTASWDSVLADLRQLDARYLVINEAVEEATTGEEYGFVPSDSAQAALGRRLETLGAAPVAHGTSWGIYRVSDLLKLRQESQPPLVAPVLVPAARLEVPVAASRFEVVGLQMEQAEAAVGSRLAFRVWYRARDGAERTRDPDWERLHLRLEGPMPAVPAWARPVDKVVRKLFLERKGRSFSRFGANWFPFDGIRPPRRWGDEVVSEVRSVKIPAYVPAGTYTLQLTVHEPIWRGNHTVSDYLSDEDSYTAPVLGSVTIVPREAAH